VIVCSLAVHDSARGLPALCPAVATFAAVA
jgi:hypothetical protein